mmetsp:Transcript_8530/g.21942  ORF Transcript_8530/g.21942 Transcript_8530/m.21942 type:complete len:743 (+) Transcript_8530:124-2352(+)
MDTAAAELGEVTRISSDVAALLDAEIGDRVSEAPALLAALVASADPATPTSTETCSPDGTASAAQDGGASAKNVLIEALSRAENRSLDIKRKIATQDTTVGSVLATVVGQRGRLQLLRSALAYLEHVDQIESLNTQIRDLPTGSTEQLEKYFALARLSAMLQKSPCLELHRLADQRTSEWSEVLVATRATKLHEILQGIPKLYSGGEGAAAVLIPEVALAFDAASEALVELEPPGGTGAPTPLIIQVILEPLMTRFCYHHGTITRDGKVDDQSSDLEHRYRQFRTIAIRWIRSHREVIARCQRFIHKGADAQQCFSSGVLAMVATRGMHDIDELRRHNETATTAVQVSTVFRACLDIDAAAVLEIGVLGVGSGCWSALAEDKARVACWLRYEDALMECHMAEALDSPSAWDWKPGSTGLGVSEMQLPSCAHAVLELSSSLRALCGKVRSNDVRRSLVTSHVSMLKRFRVCMADHVKQTLWNLAGDGQLNKLAYVTNAAWYVSRAMQVLAAEPEFFPLELNTDVRAACETTDCELDIEDVLTAQAGAFANLANTYLKQFHEFAVDPFRRAFSEYAKVLSRCVDSDDSSVTPVLTHALKTLRSTLDALRMSLGPALFSEFIEWVLGAVNRTVLDGLLVPGFTLTETAARQLRYDVENGVAPVFIEIAPDAAGLLCAALEACRIVTFPEAAWLQAMNSKNDADFLAALADGGLGGDGTSYLEVDVARQMMALRFDLRLKHDKTHH